MKNLGRYILILIIVIVLWNSIIIKPLKIFAVFLHELGHALMAFVFGFGIQSFSVRFNESGYVLAQSKGWFSEFMIANGGYLGSILFSLLILYLSRTMFKKYILGSLAIIFLIISLKFSGFSFALLYAVAFAAVIMVLYMIQNEKLNEWFIDILGISSAAYAIYDTFVDTILIKMNQQFKLISGWKGQVTDAMHLEKLTGIPAVVWGVIWLTIAMFAVNAVILKQPRASRSRR